MITAISTIVAIGLIILIAVSNSPKRRAKKELDRMFEEKRKNNEL